MHDTMPGETVWDLEAMAAKIAEIEASLKDLRDLGQGLPAVEMNARSMLACIYVLKCGISQIAEL